MADSMTTPRGAKFFEVQVSLEPHHPTLIVDHFMSLTFALVTRDGRKHLDESWNTPGVYMLLSRSSGDNWSVYVGKASDRGLVRRVTEHAREKPDWTLAVLMRRDTDGWLNASHQSWLERHLYFSLKEMLGVTVDNGNTPPGDQGVRVAEAATLETIAEQMLRVLAIAGFRSETSTTEKQPKKSVGAKPDPAGSHTYVPVSKTRKRVVKTGSIQDLIAQGLLHAGDELKSTQRLYPGTAKVLGDGRLEVDGVVHPSLSAAGFALILKGGGKNGPNGWTFWGVERGGSLVPLDDLRSQLK